MNTAGLRIGNWISDHEGIPRRVSYIGDGVVGLDIGNGSTQKYQHNPLVSGNLDDLKPLKISSEWLERLGFKPTPFVKTYFLKSYLFLLDDNKLCFDNEEPITEVDIEFVHQLQNLWFDIRGEELEIHF